MVRLAGLLLILLAALPVRAQFRPFADPTLWASASFGGIMWAQGVDLDDRDNIISNFSVTVASPRWMVQGGTQISGNFELFETDRDFATFRSAYAVGGPWTASGWFMAGAAVGPAVTWGIRERRLPAWCDVMLCERDERYERYLNLGLAGSVQGFARLDGRVWVGGETMVVLNPSSSHLASRAVIRVDLLRPDR